MHFFSPTDHFNYFFFSLSFFAWQELPCVGGVLDDTAGPGTGYGRLAGPGPDTSREEWRCVDADVWICFGGKFSHFISFYLFLYFKYCQYTFLIP